MSILFRQDRLGMLLTSLSQGLSLCRQLGLEKVELGGLPRGSVKPANGLTSAWCLVSLGQQQEQAWDFFDWWFSPETFELACFGPDDTTPADSSYIYPLLSLFAPHIRKAEEQDPFNRKIYDIIIHEKMQYTEHPYLREIEEIIQTYYWYAVSGSLSVDEAQQGAVTKINKLQIMNVP
jgi:hypothetical protein